MTRRSRTKPKIVSDQARLGQEGVNLIERVVLRMGSRWVPSPVLDVGIDGIIELVDPNTKAALGIMLHVQSRASERPFISENAEGFEYLCEDRELAYWLQGNAPVILVISRPSQDEAYWVSIKDYFAEPTSRASRRIHFDKRRDRFDSTVYRMLVDLAAPIDSGIYQAALPSPEVLVSNLLPVKSFASTIYLGSTDARDRDEVWVQLKQAGYSGSGEWYLKEGKVASFLDLRDAQWPTVIDRGSVEEFSAAEWAQSDDEDVTRDFVRLLNAALREKLYPLVRRWSDEKLFAFSSTADLRDRRIASHGKKGSGRLVFSTYMSKRTGRRVAYRHQAFSAQFRRHDHVWYLEILPTYLFTSDGRRVSRRNGDYVAAMKRLERNSAVLGNLRVCAEVLTRPSGLLSDPYPFLAFEPLLRLRSIVGINDSEWEQRAERAPSATGDDEQQGLWA